MASVIETLNWAGEYFWQWHSAMTVQVTILVVILAVIDRVIRRRSRAVFRYGLWLLVLVKLVLPPSLVSPLGLARWISEGKACLSVTVRPAVASKSEPRSVAVKAKPLGLPVTSNTKSATVESFSTNVPAPIPDHRLPIADHQLVTLIWQGLCLLLWFVGVLALLLLLIQRILFVKGLAAQAVSCEESLQAVLEDCRRRVGLSCRVTLRLISMASSPAVCGLWRPVILMPRDLVEDLSERDLRAVFLHECAHVMRGDLWVNLVQTLLQIVYFYNPLLWWANAQIRRVRETAVDEAVLVALKNKAAEYPESLVGIARMTLSRPWLSLRLIGVVENRNELKGRIRHMLNRPFPKTTRLGWAGIGMLMGVAVLLPMAGAQSGGSIAGHVFDANGGPVPGAVVMICDANSGVPLVKQTYRPMTEAFRQKASSHDLAFATTDTQGRFKFDEVPQGTYRLVAQSWQNIPAIKGMLEKNGAEIHLRGVVEVARPGRDIEIRPLGDAVLKLDQHVPNDETLMVLSTRPTRADPILGFAGWGGPFMQQMLGGNRLPAGRSTIYGLPAGTIYLALFAADSAPAFADGQVRIQAGQVTVLPEIPFVGTWSNCRTDPPPLIQPVFDILKQMSREQLVALIQSVQKQTGFDYRAAQAKGLWGMAEAALPVWHKTVSLPDGQVVTVQQWLTALQYLRLQKIVERKRGKPVTAQKPTPAPAQDNSLQALIDNANRGIYLGNISGSGTIENNLLLHNGDGISGFARADYHIRHNVIDQSDYAGIAMRDSCRLKIDHNILVRNGQGVIMFKEGTRNNNDLGPNTFWQNATDVNNLDKAPESLDQDPRFVDPHHGDYTSRTSLVVARQHGLTDPAVIKRLWQRYQRIKMDSDDGEK